MKLAILGGRLQGVRDIADDDHCSLVLEATPSPKVIGREMISPRT